MQGEKERELKIRGMTVESDLIGWGCGSGGWKGLELMLLGYDRTSKGFDQFMSLCLIWSPSHIITLILYLSKPLHLTFPNHILFFRYVLFSLTIFKSHLIYRIVLN